MLKYSHFSHVSEAGHTVIPLFGKADAYFEKTAAPALMPEVAQYINALRPVPTSQYVLVNAMGAGEYYSSNINGDHFPEAALIHKPDNWTGNPVIDAPLGKSWAYGFPTFYGAHPFAHHRNKDPGRAFGEVELAAWNPHMRRVELVTRVDHDKCEKFGGTAVWDKLQTGQFPDVSMGSKVPFDTCCICLDWERYKSALATFDPKKHKHPGTAVLEVHKKSPIRGVSITRKDYCEHARTQMNTILPDGRKVFVYNDFPRFFDISFVFIGADRTAKTMLFIFSGGKRHHVKPSAEVADEVLSLADGEKAASADAKLWSMLSGESEFDKTASEKAGEIAKQHMPSNLVSKAVPLMTRNECSVPPDVLNGLSALPLEASLSTLGGMGIVLRPQEFQRLMLVSSGNRQEADSLEAAGKIFPQVDEVDTSVKLSPERFLAALLPLLLPFLLSRSALGPVVEERALILGTPGRGETKIASVSHSTDLLRKIAAAYNGYRQSVMELVPHSQQLLEDSGVLDTAVTKLAHAPVEEVITPLTAHYLQTAFMSEVGDSTMRVVKI